MVEHLHKILKLSNILQKITIIYLEVLHKKRYKLHFYVIF